MNNPGLSFKFLDQHLLLLPEKAIYWEEKNALILADVHLGKVGHFRKAGIGIPRIMEQEDLATLSDLIHHYKPDKVIFLGDLFHSDMNNDWDWLVLWRSLFQNIELILVLGNHDILNRKFYDELNFRICDSLDMHPFHFTHAPLKAGRLSASDNYLVCGHIHPGVTLRGAGRQILTLPCFHFGKHQAIMPAFGKFTGRVSIKNLPGDQVFAIVKDKIMAL